MDYRIGVGDAALYPRLMRELGVPDEAREAILDALARRDFVGLERGLAEPGIARRAASQRCSRVPQLRGGAEVLERRCRVGGRRPPAACRRCYELLEPAASPRGVIFDLGLVRSIGYYTGAVFEVYDPALGAPLGGGGRYDELARPLRPRPAGGRASRSTSTACTSPLPARSEGPGALARDGRAAGTA